MLTSREVALIAGVTFAGAGALTYATLSPQSQWFGPMLVAPPNIHQLALTFDDGPNPSATPQLLEVLARHGVRATFFLIGKHVRMAPGLVREIAAAGHAIGNHTMTHPWLPRMSAQKIHAQLADCNKALEDTLGTPVRLFRAPHGSRTPAVLRSARALGLDAVGWNLIVGDWNALPATTLLERLERGLKRNVEQRWGTNVVLHDGGQHTLTAPRLSTVEAVSQLLDRLPPETAFVTPLDWHSSSPHTSMAE